MPAQPTQTVSLPPHTAGPSTSRTPTLTPRPTQTLTPLPSPTSTLAPAPVIEPYLVLENFQGEWSPAASELAGVMLSDEVGAGRLVLAAAPDFALTKLDAKNHVDAGITWTPDGKTLLYGVQVEGDWEGTTLWMIEKAQKTSKPTALLSSALFVLLGLDGPANRSLQRVPRRRQLANH
jgi:hypothetical protein